MMCRQPVYVVERRSSPSHTGTDYDQIKDSNGTWWQMTPALPTRGTGDRQATLDTNGVIHDH